jgi:cysteine desulfurase/selenocysteine lyase
MRIEDFPILNQTIDGRRLVDLDSGATTQKPAAVIEAVSRYYNTANANVHRAQHSLAARATSAYEDARKRVRRFINAGSTSEIVYTHGTTESINLVARSFGRTLEEGDAVLLTEMEHHSNLIPWQLMAAEKGIELRFLPFDESGVLDYGELDKLWDNRIKIVGATHVSNVFGTINDVRRIIEFAHKRDVPVLLDGAQAAGHIPVDVRDLDADFYAFSGHKMCGPTGIGILYAKEEILNRLEPFMGGGEMITAVWLDRAQWNELPYKFEAGTPNIAGAVGLGAAIEYLDGIGVETVAAHDRNLVRYAVDKLNGVEGLVLYGAAEDRGGVLSFNLGDIHAHDLAQFLDSRMVAVRAGHHCAHPIMRKLGLTSTARASLYLYNDENDIDTLVEALTECGEFFKRGV